MRGNVSQERVTRAAPSSYHIVIADVGEMDIEETNEEGHPDTRKCIVFNELRSFPLICV